VRGAVSLARPGSGQIPARAGTAVAVADVVTAGPDGFAQITLVDDGFVSLGPGAQVRVSQYSWDPVSGRRTVTIALLAGQARFTSFRELAPGSSLRVTTENAVVTAGIFADFVATALADGMDVAVLDRSAVLRHAKSWVVGTTSLGRNQRAAVRNDRPPEPAGVLREEERRQLLRTFRTR
jgi:hypothetical protein